VTNVTRKNIPVATIAMIMLVSICTPFMIY